MTHLSPGERALRWTPDAAQTISKQPWNFPSNYPRFLASGRGAHVLDDEGRRYVDWMCGNAAVTLGHARPELVEALVRTACAGGAFGLPTAAEGRVAERFCETVGAEQVRWSNTGSEANEGAVRIARCATGRDGVVSCGYHGWFAPFVAGMPEHPGVPAAFEPLIRTFVYNDLRSLDLAILTSEHENVAAIVLEPTLVEPPTPDFLRRCRARADEIGALLIFDEVITGFRWAERGAGAVFGVEPDLTVWGKGISNGMFPVSAITGRRALMRHAHAVSGTYNGHPVGLAVVEAALDVYAREEACHKIALAGLALIEAFERAADRWPQAGGRIVGQPPHPVVRFIDDEDRRRLTLFLRVMADHGVLVHPTGFNPSAAHGEAEIAATAAAMEAALRAVATASYDLVAAVPTPIGAGWRPQ